MDLTPSNAEVVLYTLPLTTFQILSRKETAEERRERGDNVTIARQRQKPIAVISTSLIFLKDRY